MNVVVNGRFLSRQVTGVERYGREILCRMEAQPRVIRSNRWARGAAGYTWEQLILPFYIHTDEVLWSPANLGPLIIKNQVLTLHDLSPLEHPEWFTPLFALWYRLMIPRLSHRVRKITVPSVYVQSKAIRLLYLRNDQAIVVPGGVDLDLFHPGIPAPEDLPERFVLFVGTWQPRKNMPVLLQAWKQIHPLVPDVWLIAAGAMNTNFQHEALPENMERFRWLGYVRDEDLPGLYAGAQVFVLPSLDEGYGLPILEAMACGTPVIVARAGAMPEVAGDAALLFNPSRADELADCLLQCLNNAALRATLIERGLVQARRFQWDFSARMLSEVLEKCL